jgi:hypothetical protein
MSYKLFQSKLIQNNSQSFIKNCEKAYQTIKDLYGEDSTWNYYKYNFFSITSSSILFYNLYKELNYHIRSFIGNDQPLWIQSWLNYHENDKILNDKLGENLGFHDHHGLFHGYISIEPQNTITKFRNGLEIKNKTGQIYIGPALSHVKGKNGEWGHYVTSQSPLPSPRITIAFDIVNTQNEQLNLSYIPLL